MLSLTRLALEFPAIGTPTQALRHYRYLKPELDARLQAEDPRESEMLFDLSCLAELRAEEARLQKEADEKRERRQSQAGHNCEYDENEEDWELRVARLANL